MGKTLVRSEGYLREMVAATLQPNLTRNQRMSLETCIAIHIHQKVRSKDVRQEYGVDPYRGLRADCLH
jgi:dynein heavy chain, axonemal